VTASAAFWIFVGGLPVVVVLTVAAKSLRRFSRHRLDDICQAHDAREQFGHMLRLHGRVGLAVENLSMLAILGTVAAATYWLIKDPALWRDGDLPPLTAAVGSAVAMLACAAWIPWTIAQLWAEPFLYRTWKVWRIVSRLTWPVVVCGDFVDVVLHRLAGRPRQLPDEETFEEEIRSIVTEGHREGLLEEDAREMIEGVIELSDAVVSEIMTPRTDMVSIHVGLNLEEAAQFAVQATHSRIPVFDKNRDDIVGILYGKDLLPQLIKEPVQRVKTLKEIVRPPHYVPETKPVDAILQEFQKTHNHMAIVLDEYGGVAGLVTIEDVLEEIVGEIADEYDSDLVEGIRQIDSRTCELLARVHIDEINDRLHIELPEDGDFDTIGGFVLSQLGRVPAVGEEVRYGNIKITVLEVTPRRIERVRLETLDEVPRATA